MRDLSNTKKTAQRRSPLSKKEQERFLAKVKTGVFPTKAAKALRITYDRVTTTRQGDPVFEQRLGEARELCCNIAADLHEEVLFDWVNGHAIETTTRRTPVLDGDGNPTGKWLVKEEVTNKKAASPGLCKMMLLAHKEKYRDLDMDERMKRLERNMDIETLTNSILDKLKEYK